MKHYIGVDVGGSKILSILASCDTSLSIVDRRKVSTRQEGGGSVIERIEESIETLLSKSGMNAAELSGIGIVVPGPTDKKTGSVIECPNIPELNGVCLSTLFSEKFGVPVHIDNDAHAAALAESRNGAGRGLRDFVYICLGTGIGCGIIIDSELYVGADGVAGELSHVVFPGLGSFHDLASGKALLNKFSIDAEEMEALCEQNDPRGYEALRHLIHYFGVGVGNMVTLFNPEAIVIGGGLAMLGDLLMKPLESEIRKNAFSIGAKSVSIIKAEHSTDAGAIGAVYLCRDRG